MILRPAKRTASLPRRHQKDSASHNVCARLNPYWVQLGNSQSPLFLSLFFSFPQDWRVFPERERECQHNTRVERKHTSFSKYTVSRLSIYGICFIFFHLRKDKYYESCPVPDCLLVPVCIHTHGRAYFFFENIYTLTFHFCSFSRTQRRGE